MTDIGKEVLQEFTSEFRENMKKQGASSGNSELLLRLEHVTKAGQIQEGDNLIILDNRGGIHVEKAKVVIRPGVACDCDGEEIVIRKMRNIYFITDVYLKGKSWVKECHIVKAQ